MARWLQGENAQMHLQDWFLATCGGEAGGGAGSRGSWACSPSAGNTVWILCVLSKSRIGKGPEGG